MKDTVDGVSDKQSYTCSDASSLPSFYFHAPKKPMNEDDETCLLSQVHKRGEVLLSKDEEINSLQSAMKERDNNSHDDEKDLKIAELLAMLGKKEEELRYYEKALEQYVTEY